MQSLIYMHTAKGSKDRMTFFPKTIHADIFS
jgi:hypothetical protein